MSLQYSGQGNLIVRGPELKNKQEVSEHTTLTTSRIRALILADSRIISCDLSV